MRGDSQGAGDTQSDIRELGSTGGERPIGGCRSQAGKRGTNGIDATEGRASKGEYGWPRIWRELWANSVRVWKERVRRLMKENGIKAYGKRKFVVTADSKHDLPIAPNLLNRNFCLMHLTVHGQATHLYSNRCWLVVSGSGS